MYYSLNGKIIGIESNAIIIDVNGVGYLVYTPNPYCFEIGGNYTVYVYHQVREDEEALYGFKTLDEKNLFLKLISVKGLGPKMALPMIATGSINGILDAIDRENILYLKKFPKIGEKLARQIILDLKGKMTLGAEIVLDTSSSKTFDELIDVLKGLGYKDKEIKPVLAKIDVELPIEQQVKEALKLLLR